MPDLPKRSEQPREPTPDERLKVRELLTVYFDDETGAYASGYSDQRIALEAGDIPWAVVTRIRDAGWGPIRQTPEIVEVRRELDTLKQEYAKMDAETRDLAAVMQKEIGEGLDKVTKLEARVVALASSAGRKRQKAQAGDGRGPASKNHRHSLSRQRARSHRFAEGHEN